MAASFAGARSRAAGAVAGAARARAPRRRRAAPARAGKPGDFGDEDKLGEGEGMSIPSDMFGCSPEEKCAQALQSLFTSVGVRVVMEQWIGSRHRSPMYNKMIDYLEENPIKGGNSTEWLATMMRHEELDFRLAAVRIVEVRQKYAKAAFDWDDMKLVALAGIEKDSRELLGAYMTQSFDAGSDSDDDE